MGLITRKPAVLVLEDGSVFEGFSLGKIGVAMEKFAIIQE